MNLKTITFVFASLVLLATLANGQSLPYNKLDKLKVNDLIAKKLEVQSTTQSSIPCPSMTQVQRDAISTPQDGSCVYNSDTNVLNIYDGSAWVEVGSGGGGAGGIANWETAKFYEVDDVVIESNKIYQANTQHTSSVFASDIAYWTQIANNVSDVTGVLPMANGGTDKALSPVLGGVVYTDAGSMEILGAGTSGQFLKSNGGAAPSWEDVVVNDSSFSGLLSLGKGGTNKNLSAENGAILYLDADSVEKLSPGSSGQVLQSNGSAAPNFVNKSISGKAGTNSSVTLEEIQVSNNQLTQTDTNKHLIESGNKNILINSSFEHSTFSTGWTNSIGTFTEDTIVEIDGLKAAKLVLSSQTMSLSQNSTLYASQFADGVQGLASVRVKSDVALKVCSVQAGVVSTTNCVNVQANNKWGHYKVPFILGATSNGISIASTGAVSGTVYIDDAFVGAVDLSATVDASKVAGEAYFVGTTSCQWNRTSTTLGAFTATAACPGPTIVYSSMGQWQTTDSDLPRVTINNLPAGTYKAKFIVREFTSLSTNGPVLAINDGTTTCEPIAVNESNSVAIAQTIECTFIYTSSGNRVFELYGASPANAISLGNALTAPRASTKFILEYFGSGSTYSSTNADTDWASCTFSSLAWQGLGTVTNDLRCKRQGSDLLIGGRFVVGTVSANTAQIPLPLFNGVQLVTKSIPAHYEGGRIIRAVSTTTGDHVAVLQSSSSFFTIGVLPYSTASSNSYTSILGNTFGNSGESVTVNARIPIEGWENSNIIIGQFNGLESCLNSYECSDTYSAKISSAGVVSDENLDWINGNATISATSVYAITFKSGIFTQAPNCVATVQSSSSISIKEEVAVTSLGGSWFTFTVASSPSASAQAWRLICQKQGVDYIGKTAKAVASDQNMRVVGSIKAIMCSAELSTTNVISNQYGNCFSSSSGTTTKTILFNAGTWGSNPNCWCNYKGAGATSGSSCIAYGESSSQFTIKTFNNNALINDVSGIFCTGVSP